MISHMLGGPGSGKSSIAAKIATTFGMEAYDLDDLFWDPDAPTYGARMDEAKRNRALAALVMRDAWVIEGAYYKLFDDPDLCGVGLIKGISSDDPKLLRHLGSSDSLPTGCATR